MKIIQHVHKLMAVVAKVILRSINKKKNNLFIYKSTREL